MQKSRFVVCLLFVKKRNYAAAQIILDEMQSDKELEENNSLNNLFLEPSDYNKCCLWGDPRVDVCGSASRRE